MRTLFKLLFLLCPLPAIASTYTIAAPHLTMHVGDPLPPLIFSISTYSGSYASHFKGQPNLSTTASARSNPGAYPIVVDQGSMTSVDGSNFKLVNGVLEVIAADDIGAKLTNGILYPPGFLSGPGFPVLDVTHNATANLVGDCVTDNAANFAKLLTQNGRRTPATTNGGGAPINLYFPPGCYATSEPLTIYGSFWHLWGAGPQSSIIKLLPNSQAFNSGKPTQFFSPLSVTQNSNFSEYLYNLGIEIGVGNPNAIPFTTVQNNSGSVRNVQIWADDSACPYAINFNRAYPGPMLLKNVAVYGCKLAYSAGQGEFNVTFEGFTTEAQTVGVLDNHYIKASIRHWLSDNSVQALHVYGSTTSNVAVLDSEIRNGASGTAGIAVDPGSSVYLKNLLSTGYNPTESDAGSGPAVNRTGNIVQAWTGTPQSLFNSAQGMDSLHLPVRETPAPNDPPLRQWTKLSQNATDWPAQIQGSSSPTLYAPAGVYLGNAILQVKVPPSVSHLQFYQSKFTSGAPKLILTIADSSTTPLIIDSCPYESCEIIHTGSRPIVLLDTTLYSYASQNGAGDFYIEDSILSEGANGSIPVNFYPSQHIWARQLNLEQHTVDKFHCSGCKMWILGYKTEEPTPSIVLTDNAQAEIFGFFFYQNRAPSDPISANIRLTDSSLFATGWTKVDVPGRGQPNWVIENQGARSSSLATRDVNTSQQLNVFYSFGGGKSSEHEDTGNHKRPSDKK